MINKEDIKEILKAFDDGNGDVIIEYISNEQVKNDLINAIYNNNDNHIADDELETIMMNLINDIISQIPEELIDYFENLVVSFGLENIFFETPKEIKEAKEKYYNFIDNNPNIFNDEEKIEILQREVDSIYKYKIILKIEDDDKKIELMQSEEELNFAQKAKIIETIKDDDKKIRLMQSEEELNLDQKAKIIETIKNDDKKIELMQSGEELNFAQKSKIIETIKDDDKKIRLMQSEEELNLDQKAKIITTIQDDNKKIYLLKNTPFFTWYEHREMIITTIKDDDKKIEVMKSTERLDSDAKLWIITTIKDDDKKIEAMKSTEILDPDDKSLIITTIKDDDKKIEVMKNTEGLTVLNKAKIIETIKDDDKKIEVMQNTEKLDSDAKSLIIATIKDDDKKIETMKNTEGLSSSDKANILLSYIENNDDNKILEVIKSIDELDDIAIWQKIREKIKSELIIDNLQLFIDHESNELLDHDYVKDLILRMYAKNKYVIKQIDFNIIQPKYIDSLGEEKINLLSCYPELQRDILKLSDKQLTILDKCLDVFMEQNETDEWTALAKHLIYHMDEYEKLIKKIEDDKGIENLSTEDIISLSRIMQEENWCEIESLEEVHTYDTIIKNKYIEVMENEDATLEEKRRAIMRGIFGHGIYFAEEMILKYGEDIENLEDCGTKDYIRALKLIMNIKDKRLLNDIFKECDFAQIDKIQIERELKTEYFKLYLKDLYIPTEEYKLNEKDNIYEAGKNFKILMTSVRPFSGYWQSNRNRRL